MAGQIIARGKGVWLVRVYLGTDPDTGKRTYENRTVHANKKTAEGELTKLLRDRDTGKLRPGGQKLTVGTLLDDLLLDYKVNGKGYEWASIVVENLRPAFGGLSISKLSSDRIKKYIGTRQAAGRANAAINHELLDGIIRGAANRRLNFPLPAYLRYPVGNGYPPAATVASSMGR